MFRFLRPSLREEYWKSRAIRAEDEASYAQEQAIGYAMRCEELEGDEPGDDWMALHSTTASRLRENTHSISERLTQRLGHLQRKEERTRRALQRALALIGTNMAYYEGRLLHTPGAESFTEDIRYIHGLVPEYKFITDIAYKVEAHEAITIAEMAASPWNPHLAGLGFAALDVARSPAPEETPVPVP